MRDVQDNHVFVGCGSGLHGLEASGPVGFANALLDLLRSDFEAKTLEFFCRRDGERYVAVLMTADERRVNDNLFGHDTERIAVASGCVRDVHG